MKNKIYLVFVEGTSLSQVFKTSRRVSGTFANKGGYFHYFKKEISAQKFVRKLNNFCHATFDERFKGSYFEGGGFYQNIVLEALEKEQKNRRIEKNKFGKIK
jgi:hypothetical protein